MPVCWSLLLLHRMIYVHPNWSTLERILRSDAQAVSWHSVALNSRFWSLTYLLHPQHCPLILSGAPWQHSSRPIYYLVSITLESKKGSKLSKNRGKNKSLTELRFVLYSTSISCWKRALLFPQNTLHACMTELHYLAFERQKLSHPKQLAEQHYNENALEKHRLDWQIKYRNCPTTPA